MKKQYYIIIILAFCIKAYSQNKIYVKDKSQYDSIFIQGLQNYAEPLKLIDNYIQVGDHKSYFPSVLVLNKKTTYKAVKNNTTFFLTLIRINQTTINYSLTVSDNTKTLMSKSGKAILGSFFFFAAEIDEDPMGEGYAAYEYYDKNTVYELSIRVGEERDVNQKQRVKIIYLCKDKTKQQIPLDECPVLRTE